MWDRVLKIPIAKFKETLFDRKKGMSDAKLAADKSKDLEWVKKAENDVCPITLQHLGKSSTTDDDANTGDKKKKK